MRGMKQFVKAMANCLGLHPFLSGVSLLARKQSWRYGSSRIGRVKALASTLARARPITARTPDARQSAEFHARCRSARIGTTAESLFLYSPDFFLIPTSLPIIARTRLGNLVPGYAEVLTRGVSGIKEDVERELSTGELDTVERAFLQSLLEVCDGIRLYQHRCCRALETQAAQHGVDHPVHQLLHTLRQVPEMPARTLREAIQSYLVVNSLLWTSGYRLIGLGRLDQMLLPYLEADVQTGVLDVSAAFSLIKAFLGALHEGYYFKSNVLPGDTGQAVVLGGCRSDGSDAGNTLTVLFLDALRELKLPDPKLVLRVHPGTPVDHLTRAVECATAGVPILLTNDSVIIAALERFGYSRDDAYDYGVSACWEPLVPGKSLDQNNLATINFLQPMEEALWNERGKPNGETEFTDLLDSYLCHLRSHVRSVAETVEKIRFESAPLLSAFTKHCIVRHKDIANGGADYNNSGLLTVGLGNAVNALLNIQRSMQKEARVPLAALKQALKNGFSEDHALLADLRNGGPKFGCDDPESIRMTNFLIQTVSDVLEGRKNFLGGGIKFGLSSPGFVDLASGFPASADGRRASEPFGAHIAPLPGSPNIALTSLGSFASCLHYQRAFNGAVTDVVVDRGTIHSQSGSFVGFVKGFCAQGGMQLQISVLDCDALIEARRNPAAYPTLVVRVWGFSAYFKDLPPEYQDYLIEKARRFAASRY